MSAVWIAVSVLAIVAAGVGATDGLRRQRSTNLVGHWAIVARYRIGELKPPRAIEICARLAQRARNDLGFERTVAVVFAGGSAAGVIHDAQGRTVIVFDDGPPGAGGPDSSRRTSAIAKACASQEPMVCRARTARADPVIHTLLPSSTSVLVVPMSRDDVCVGYVLAESGRHARQIADARALALLRLVRATEPTFGDPTLLQDLEEQISFDQLAPADASTPAHRPHSELVPPMAPRTGEVDRPDRPQPPTRLTPTGSTGAALRHLYHRPRAMAYGLLAAAVVLAPLLAVTGPQVAAAIVGLPAILLAPGAALTGFFTINDLGDEVLLSLATSIVVDVLGTQLMLALGLWHPEAFALLVATTGVLLVRHAVRTSRRAERSAPVVLHEASG